MHNAFKLSTLAAAGVALLASLATAGAQEPIRIGVLQPMTGQATKNVIENFTAMQIARWGWRRGWGLPLAAAGLGLGLGYPYYSSAYYSDPCVAWNGYTWVNICY